MRERSEPMRVQVSEGNAEISYDDWIAFVRKDNIKSFFTLRNDFSRESSLRSRMTREKSGCESRQRVILSEAKRSRRRVEGAKRADASPSFRRKRRDLLRRLDSFCAVGYYKRFLTLQKGSSICEANIVARPLQNFRSNLAFST